MADPDKLENIDALFIGEGIFFPDPNDEESIRHGAGGAVLMCNWCSGEETIFHKSNDYQDKEWLVRAIQHLITFHADREIL